MRQIAIFLVLLAGCASGPFSRYRSGVENGPLPVEVRVAHLHGLTQRMLNRYPTLEAVCFMHDMGDRDLESFPPEVISAVQSQLTIQVRPGHECWKASENTADPHGILELARSDGSVLHAGMIGSGSWKRTGEFAYSVAGVVDAPDDLKEAGWYEVAKGRDGEWLVTGGPYSSP